MINLSPHFRCPGRLSRFQPATISYLLAMLIFTGCERQADPRNAPGQSSAKIIALIGPEAGNPRWPAIRGGAQAYVASIGTVRLICEAPADSSASALVNSVEHVLRQHPQAIALYVYDSKHAQPAVERIEADQLPLITVGAVLPDVLTAGQVRLAPSTAAELLGENLSEIASAAGVKSYLIIHEDGRSETDTDCYRRFTSAAQREVGVHLLEQANAAATPNQSIADHVARLLDQYRHAGLVVTLAPDVWLRPAPGWLARLRASNQNFHFATTSAVPPLWPQLGTPDSPGRAAALVGELDGDLGRYAVRLAVEHLMGSSGGMSTTRRVEPELVTAHNLPDFARRYAEAAGNLDISPYLPNP